MSFVRFGTGGSQVYIYEDVAGYVKCCFCGLNSDWTTHEDFRTTDLDAMLAHVAEHRAAGHDVPDFVDVELRSGWPFPAGVDGYGIGGRE